ncbi:hypothetical protein SNEBB_011269 [Seison nebaliae]|nr:hypothetical protein SNEBB_011269 [Seison nebaliae]
MSTGKFFFYKIRFYIPSSLVSSKDYSPMVYTHNAEIRCKDHPDARLVEDHRAGDLICCDCGLVVGDRVVDVGSEWRTFSNDKDAKDMSRVGAAENSITGVTDLSTRISTAGGRHAYNDNGQLKYRTHNTMTSKQRSITQATRLINDYAEKLRVKKMIAIEAEKLYAKVFQKKTIKGKPHQAVSCGCLAVVLKLENNPRSFKEFAAVSGVQKKDITRAYSEITKLLQNEGGETSSKELSTKSSCAKNFIERFSDRLEVSNEVQELALHIEGKVTKIGALAGRNPISVTSACVYIATQLAGNTMSRTVKEVSDVTGSAEGTIKLIVKAIRKIYKTVLPEKYASKSDVPF